MVFMLFLLIVYNILHIVITPHPMRRTKHTNNKSLSELAIEYGYYHHD